MVDDMFRIGTTRARRVLKSLRDGIFYDECDAVLVDRAVAAELADKLIALGRAAKAAR